MKRDFAGRTHVGRIRNRNEDALLQRPERGLFAVADGMGGHAGGDIASRIAVDVLDERTSGPAEHPATQLDTGIRAAHDAILKAARADSALRGMGTTLTALWFHRADAEVVVAHVGDSRAYRLRDGALKQLTRDQTWVQDQVDAGLLSANQARRHPYSAMLTCALGVEDVVLDVQIMPLPTRPGDVYLLCTDGLVARLDEEDIQPILERPQPLDAVAEALVDAANQAGGPDNITVALIRLSSDE
jgi:PPM family protein phosphatase